MLLIVLILIPLVKLLDVTKKPWLCAIIFTVTMTVFQLMVEVPFETVIISSAIRAVISFAYFYILSFTTGIVWWLVFIFGMGFITLF
jgi:hypothetical protein